MSKKYKLNRWIIVIPILVCWIMPLQADDIQVNVIMQPAANFMIEELKAAIYSEPNRWAVDQIVMITLSNTTQEKQSLKLRVKLYASKIDPSSPLADYTTSYAHYPIDIEPGEVKVINSAEQNMITGGILRSDKSEIRNKIKRAYSKQNVLGYSGWIPEDTYTYEILVFNKNDDETNESNALGKATETIKIPPHSTTFDIFEPVGNMIDVEYPMFSWEEVNVRDGIDVSYEINLYEVSDFNSIRTNDQALFQTRVDNKTSLRYSGSPNLKQGQKYRLEINAFDEANLLIASSIVKDFQYGNIEPPMLINNNIEEDKFPITLEWTSLDKYSEYRIIVTEDAAGQRSVLEQTVADKTRYELDDIYNIVPGKTYYWYVEMVMNSGVKIKSDIGQLKLNQFLKITSPTGDEVIGVDNKDIRFAWDGNPYGKFVLKISSEKSMQTYQRFVRFGDEDVFIDIDDLNLERDSVQYWTVREIDDQEREWGINPEPGSFKLERLEAPKLDSTFVQAPSDDISLSFTLMNWAEYYRVDIISNDGKILFSRELDSGTLRLRLDDIPNIELNKTYRWTVTAISEHGREEERSQEGQLIINSKTKIAKKIELINKPDYLTPSAIIEWDDEIGRDGFYLLYISKEPRFETDPEIIRVEEPRYRFVSVDRYKSDIYYKVVAYDENENEITETDIAKISISDTDILYEDIVLIEPESEIPKSQPWMFKWIPDIQDATLLISTDKSLKDAQEFKVSGTGIKSEEIMDEFKLGVSYFWSLKKDGHADDMVYEFKIVPTKLKLIQPVNKDRARKSIIFQWTGDTKSNYQLIVAKDKECENIIDTIETEDLMYKYKLNKYERIYWKVKELDNNNVIQESEVAYVNYVSPSSPISLKTRNRLERFIKKRLDNRNEINVEDWKLVHIKALNTDIDDEDINHLLENEDAFLGFE